MYAKSLLSVIPFLASSVLALPPSNHGPKHPGRDAAADLLACAKAVLPDANIITPSSPSYGTARTGVITLNDQYPALVVYPTEASQVGPLVKCGVKTGFKIAPRTGQHHFENWSSLNGSLVIDIENLSYVLPAKDLKSATVGGGSRLGALYSILDKYGITFTAGICPSVGIGGYLGVGGYNMQMRTHGFAVDKLKSAKVVTAAGDLITVSATSNPDLWWAIRGGGTFGVVVEAVLETTTLPRSAMVVMNFDNTTRFEVLKKYNDWAPRQDPYFESQMNFYSDRTQILGWYLGKSVAELQAIVKTSGLQDVANGQIKITGNCSTANSRNFWTYTQDECTDDATAETKFFQEYNVAPTAFTPVPGSAAVSVVGTTPARPEIAPAVLWSRANIYTKTFVETKDKPFSDADLQWIVDNTKNLPSELGFWFEITTFNVSTPASNSAFPWSNAKTLWRMQVENSGSTVAEAARMANLMETGLRPRAGPYSYAGYIDKAISGGDPIKSYYGDNVCRLVKARQKFDPNVVFDNPFAVPAKAKASWNC